MYQPTILVFVFVVYIASTAMSFPGPPGPPPPHPDCQMTELEGEALANKTDMCMTKLKLSPADLPMMDENFAKNGYSDKCIFKCILTDMGLLTDDGDAKDDEFLALVRNRKMTPQYQESFEKMTVSCLSSSRKLLESSGGPKTEPCKFAAMLIVCLGEGDDEICAPPKTRR